jgi:ribosome maturation factor RimP
MEVVNRVKSLIQEYLDTNGIELVDMTYRREQGGMTLRLLADTADGISMAECEALNNFLSGRLDEENLIDEHYTLEVSSPGLDRPIITDRDFERSMGKELEISTYQAIDMKKYHEGSLIGMDKENIVIESAEISTVIPRGLIARAKLKVNFQ